MLTREDVTASVHYVRFSFTPAQVDSFAASGVVLGFDHPDYHESTVLTDETKAELVQDLRQGG
jgi:hypothetical protein